MNELEAISLPSTIFYVVLAANNRPRIQLTEEMRYKATAGGQMHDSSTDETHRHTVHVDKGLVVMEIRGRVTLESLLLGAEAVYADPQYQPSFDAILNILSDDWAVGYSDLHAYSQQIAANPKMLKGRVVIVAPDGLSFGVGRMYESIEESPSGAVQFETTIDAAFAYLAAKA